MGLLMLWLVGAGYPVSAHDVPPSIAMLDIGRKTIDAELQLQLSELGTALVLPLASNPVPGQEWSGCRAKFYKFKCRIDPNATLTTDAKEPSAGSHRRS